MSAPTMDPVFATALRHHLVLGAGPPRHGARRRWGALAGAIVAVGLAGGGVAVASGQWVLPGGDAITTLGAPAVVTTTGSGEIDLGGRPEDATHVRVELRCLTEGTFWFADGASMTCTAADAANPATLSQYDLPLSAGQTATSITTSSPAARWTATAWYITSEPTPWATNANGQTYGVMNADGEPDLIAVEATNGRTGYIYAEELAGPQPSSPEEAATWTPPPARAIDVFESDGVTVIGEFVIGN